VICEIATFSSPAGFTTSGCERAEAYHTNPVFCLIFANIIAQFLGSTSVLTSPSLINHPPRPRNRRLHLAVHVQPHVAGVADGYVLFAGLAEQLHIAAAAVRHAFQAAVGDGAFLGKNARRSEQKKGSKLFHRKKCVG
jgi:hypothetical protein